MALWLNETSGHIVVGNIDVAPGAVADLPAGYDHAALGLTEVKPEKQAKAKAEEPKE